MKRKTLKRGVLALLLATMITTTGCGASSKDSAEYASDSYDYATDDFYSNGINYSMSPSEDAMEESASEESGMDEGDAGTSNVEKSEIQNSNRKLIKTVDMQVETTEFDVLISKLTEKVDAAGGYIEQSDVYGNTGSSSDVRRANYTIRVPKNKLDNFLEAVAENSNITRKSESVEDVTLQYVDVQSKKEALEVERQRLLELIQEAQDIDTVLVIESKLTDIRYELESLESRLRTYDNQVDYSTVHMNVVEVKVYTPPKPESRLERLVDGFTSSVKGVFTDVLDFFVELIIILPYLVVWGLIIFAFVSVVKFFRKKRKAKKAAKLEAKKRLEEQKKQEVANKDENAQEKTTE